MKKTSFILLLGLLNLLGFHSVAYAQTACPPGMIPYGTAQDQSVCGPAPSSQPAQPKAPAIVWESRWGAIATDGDKGVLGTSINEKSQKKAESKAMADCQAKGGSPCKLQISYSNGCGAMVVGSNGFSTAYAGTKEEAIEKSMAVCKSDGDSACHVYYTECSPAKRVQ